MPQDSGWRRGRAGFTLSGTVSSATVRLAKGIRRRKRTTFRIPLGDKNGTRLTGMITTLSTVSRAYAVHAPVGAHFLCPTGRAQFTSRCQEGNSAEAPRSHHFHTKHTKNSRRTRQEGVVSAHILDKIEGRKAIVTYCCTSISLRFHPCLTGGKEKKILTTIWFLYLSCTFELRTQEAVAAFSPLRRVP